MASDKKVTELTQITRAALDAKLYLEEDSSYHYIEVADLVGKRDAIFDVKDYGATGDGTTDDSTAIQSAITALEANDGGVLFFPATTYKIGTGLVFDGANLTRLAQVRGYGATLDYTGSGDALTFENNVTAVDDQDAEKSYHVRGLHIKGTSSADSAIRLHGVLHTFRDMVIENFTSTTSTQAAIVLDALFLEWVEENTFDSIDIKNTGNGVCFISREDSGGAAASLMNNYFRNIHIWIKQDGGKGFYGVGQGASTVANTGRIIIDGAVIHPFESDNVVCYDFTNCYMEGSVLISPSVDAYGTCNSLVAFDYNYSEVLTVIAPTG